MATLKEKKAAHDKLTTKEAELFQAIRAAGSAGIKFKDLLAKLGIKTPNMLYNRLSVLQQAGLVKSTKQSTVSTYFADYEPR